MNVHAIKAARKNVPSSTCLSYPAAARVVRRRWVAGAFAGVGLVLVGVSFWSNRSLFNGGVLMWVGLLPAVIGLLCLGYVRDVCVWIRDRRITYREGLFFLTVTESVTFSDIKQVGIRHKRPPEWLVYVGLLNRGWWQESYEMVLNGTQTLFVERFWDHNIAHARAQELAQVIGVPYQPAVPWPVSSKSAA